jgi:hypothetical protein
VKQKRFNVEQIVAVLKQAEAGVPLAELIRRVGIPELAQHLGILTGTAPHHVVNGGNAVGLLRAIERITCSEE